MLAGCAVVEKPLAEPAPVPRTAEPSTPPCDFRGRIIDFLAEKYQESPVAIGLANTGGLVEILATDDGATWTIIVTRPDGQACMVIAGEGWRMVPDKPQAEGTAL